MADGLGMLDEQRQRRTRNIPTPRNPPRTTPVEVVELTQHPSEPAASPAPEVKPAPSPAKPEPATQEPTIKMSIYLEPSDDLYLEHIAHAGKTGRPRVAISRSAIVRLALERLADTTTNDEIVHELRKRGTHHQGRGRKRR